MEEHAFAIFCDWKFSRNERSMRSLIDSAFNRVPDELSGTRDPSQNQFCGYEFRSPLSFQISRSVILLSSPARERIKLENRAATIGGRRGKGGKLSVPRAVSSKKGIRTPRVSRSRSRAATWTDAMCNWIEIILLSFRTLGFRPPANNGDADVRATGGGANLLFKFSFFRSRPTNFRGCRRINGFPV